MTKFNRVGWVIASALLGLGLSSCGKDNYNGTYTGTEIRSASTTQGQTGQTPYPQNQAYGQSQYRGVTAQLQHDGDIVTGTYNISPTNYGTNYQSQVQTTTESYRFEANANNKNQLNGVKLIPISGYGGCVLEGTLTAIQDGRRLTGTLQPSTVGYQSGYSLCGPTQITLDRPN